MLTLIALLLNGLALNIAVGDDISTCNESVCASVVTKCLLTEHCKCNFAIGNYTCHKDCFGCLAELVYDCCSCFGLCPQSTSNPLSKVSSIEQLDDPIPQLFDLYTSAADDHVPARYTSLTFEQRKTLNGRTLTRNCTVAFANKCTSVEECRATCQNMGASFSRWFHDGCCQCVGDGCLDYGMGEARCSQCPVDWNKEDGDVDDFYYGEDDDSFFEEDGFGHNSWTTNDTRMDEEVKAVWRDPGNRGWES